MKITVAICTWNRANLLDQTLAEMRKLRISPGIDWELLVVNNNCTDDTDTVIARHSPHLPLRRLFESRQGHSNARNCAVEAANGELLIWTDDDVLVDPSWLAEYANVAQENPDAAYFGGTVDPWFEGKSPAWICRNLHALSGPYVIRQHGERVRSLSGSDTIAGANMAFRMGVQRRFPYDPNLGRTRADLVGGDDCDVLDRIKEAGYPGMWVGTARVRHFIPSARLTSSFIWQWFVGAGRTAVRARQITNTGPQLCGVPRWAIREFVQARTQSLLFAPLQGERWFHAFLQAARMWGVIQECRAQGCPETLNSVSLEGKNDHCPKMSVGTEPAEARLSGPACHESG